MPLDTGAFADGPGHGQKPASSARARIVLDTSVDVGAALRAARQSLGLALGDISETTRVRERHLAAIEAGLIDQLPSRPFSIGYVRAYATALGADADTTARVYGNFLGLLSTWAAPWAAIMIASAEPTTERRTVSIDLREDWPTALRESGFDDTKPAAWSAEGLLMYLPPEAQDRLFDHITALSAPGSQLATEYHPDTGPTMGERGRAMNDRWANLGCDVDLSGLFYEGERNNVADYLTDRGWDVSSRTRRELFGEYGRVFPGDDALAAFRNIVSVIATATGSQKKGG